VKSMDGNIWLVQSDHLSGETLGVVIQKLFDLGAMNVQVIPTITKKNRPGHLMFIDVSRPGTEDSIRKYLFKELGIFGYHVLQTQHYCETTRFVEQTLHVKHREETATFKIQVKIVGEAESVSYPRVEHEHVVAAQKEIEQRFKRGIPLRELVSVVESAVHGNLEEVTIEMNGSHKV
jgi:uncharacterized protein (DUF111 family)